MAWRNTTGLRLHRAARGLLLAGAALLLAAGASAQATLYGVTGDGATTSETIFVIDPNTGSATQLTALGAGDDGEVIVFNPQDGQLYHFSGRGGVNDPASGAIFERIDPTTGTITPVGFSGGGLNASSPSFAEEALAATFDFNSGTILVADLDQNLYQVTTTGDVTFVGNMGFTTKGMAFQGTTLLAIEQFDTLDSDGRLDLVTVDPATGQIISSVDVTLAGGAGGLSGNNSNGLAVDPATGTVYAIIRVSGNRVLATIDPASGVATPVATLGDSFAAISFLGFFGAEVFMQASITSTATALLDAGDFATTLALHGSHHRPLLLRPGLEKDHCVWLTGDLGRYRQHDGRVGLFEAGGCIDPAENLRLGLGIGGNYADLDLDAGGKADMDGVYVILEANYGFEDWPLVATVNFLWGVQDADVERGIQIGANNFKAFGETDIESMAARLRFDFTDLDAGPITLTPRLEYTHVRVEVDAYTESGQFALAFDDRDHDFDEIRVGVDAGLPLGERFSLTAMAEVVHRFDDQDPDIEGSFFGSPWSLPGAEKDTTWVRGGIGLDYRLVDRVFVSANVNVSTTGQDAQTSGSLGVRYAF